MFDNSKIIKFVPDLVATKTRVQAGHERIDCMVPGESGHAMPNCGRMRRIAKRTRLIEAYRKGWPTDKKRMNAWSEFRVCFSTPPGARIGSVC